ncbi:MAG: abortive infection family protein [Betaproteobacteria bacterium]|nr:abortive infection family protein [Betaproteobacteria bacterium]
MNLSEYTVEFLGNFIAGDIEGLPYRSGPQLVKFFNQFGVRDVYPAGGGFPTRRIYAQDKVRELNGTANMNLVLVKTLDEREFSKSDKKADEAAGMLNEHLKFDGYELVRDGFSFNVRELSSGKIKLAAAIVGVDEPTQLSIDENIRKCEAKLSEGDYSGAITNARSLIEAVLTGIERELADEAVEYDGNLGGLYKRVQKLLSLEPERKDISNALRQILSGLTSIVNGLATMRNKMSDAHASTYRPSKHHAKLAVYAATTLADFLFETKAYQKNLGVLKPQAKQEMS